MCENKKRVGVKREREKEFLFGRRKKIFFSSLHFYSTILECEGMVEEEDRGEEILAYGQPESRQVSSTFQTEAPCLLSSLPVVEMQPNSYVVCT